MYSWKELPSDYSKDFKPEVWSQMKKNPLPTAPSPWIKPDSLVMMAERMEFPDMKEVLEVACILREGADTGVTGAARLPQQAKNSPKVFEYGDRVLDTLRSWLEKVAPEMKKFDKSVMFLLFMGTYLILSKIVSCQGLMCGPFDAQELEQLGQEVKVSPLGVVLKPGSGKARVLQDLSSPHLENPNLEGVTATSFNSGIDKRMFPTMNSTCQDVLNRLFEVGAKAYMAKIDWEVS